MIRHRDDPQSIPPISRVPILTIGETGPECFIPFPLSDSVNESRGAEVWECGYCGRANQSNRLECIGCGGPKVAKAPESLLLFQGITAAQWESAARDSRERVYFGSGIGG